MKVKRKCENCNDIFHVDHWEVIRKGKGRFCGRPCVYKWMSKQHKLNKSNR